MNLSKLHRIAIFKLRNIGDVLMMTPVVRALRETFPEARITAVVNSGTEAMLAHNPDLDEVLVFQRKSPGQGVLGRIAYELRFLRELRKRRFDLTIGFTDGDRAAWYTLFCRAPYRIGSAHYSWSAYDPRRRVYNFPAPSRTPSMHEVEKHFWVLEQAGLKLRAGKPGPLCLIIPEDLRAWARQELAALRPGRIVYVHPAARWPLKCWDNEAMARVIDWLQSQPQVRVVVNTGPTPQDRTRTQEIIALCRTQPHFYDGNLSLGQTVALIAETDGFFGVDTAPMHIAAALNVPVLALFGPTGIRSWGPWSSRARILSHSCLCQETGRQACAWDQTRACMAAITFEEARDALEEMLHLPRPASAIPS